MISHCEDLRTDVSTFVPDDCCLQRPEAASLSQKELKINCWYLFLWLLEKCFFFSNVRVMVTEQFVFYRTACRCLFHVSDAISISSSISPEMGSKEEIPQYDKEQVKHVKGVLRDSIEMLEQVSLPSFPCDTLFFQQLEFFLLCQNSFCFNVFWY